MVQISRALVFLSVVSVGLALVVRNVPTVDNDFTTVTAEVMALHNSIIAFPKTGGTPKQALVRKCSSIDGKYISANTFDNRTSTRIQSTWAISSLILRRISK